MLIHPVWPFVEKKISDGTAICKWRIVFWDPNIVFDVPRAIGIVRDFLDKSKYM